MTRRFGLHGELSQPGVHADMRRKLRKPSTWPYAVDIHMSFLAVADRLRQHASEARAALVFPTCLVAVSGREWLVTGRATDARARGRGWREPCRRMQFGR